MTHKRIRGFRSRALLMALIVLMMAFPPINSVGKTVAGVARECNISENRLQRALAGKATLEMREAVRLYVAIEGREKLEGLR